MTFKKAYLKLTLFYVLIIMMISIVFSVSIYKISSNELNRGLNRQSKIIRDLPFDKPPVFDLEKIRLDQLQESNHNLALNLLYFNLLILIVSSFGSYFFAKKTLEPIQETMEAQNCFTADASHELRTPLTAIKTEIEVNLRDKDLNIDGAKKLLQSNLEEINKLESLSEALLNLAKLQDDIKLGFEKLSLAEVIVEAYEKIEKLASEKSIKFENNLQDISIKGNKSNLNELFLILIDNAIKYSPKNSIITINTHDTDKFAVIKIKDKGIGIKSSDIPHIFNRFYRADHSRNKEKINGYGLGLSIAKRIVELHNGKISVSSQVGKGTEFIIKLPKP